MPRRSTDARAPDCTARAAIRRPGQHFFGGAPGGPGGRGATQNKSSHKCPRCSPETANIEHDASGLGEGALVTTHDSHSVDGRFWWYCDARCTLTRRARANGGRIGPVASVVCVSPWITAASPQHHGARPESHLEARARPRTPGPQQHKPCSLQTGTGFSWSSIYRKRCPRQRHKHCEQCKRHR